MNRAGFCTDSSQPGEDLEDWGQRALVGGYCAEETANRIGAGLLLTDLLVLSGPTALDPYVQVPISRGGRVESTWAGAHYSLDDIDAIYAGALSPAALNAV